MIPPFNKNGYLKKGIHKATLAEIRKKFGSSSSKRRERFKELQSIVILLLKHRDSIKKLLIDGSFVTDKEEPSDIDGILLVKNNFDFNSKEANQLKKAKKLFNADLFVIMEDDCIPYENKLNLFGTDRDDIPKGFVEVIL